MIFLASILNKNSFSGSIFASKMPKAKQSAKGFKNEFKWRKGKR
tara:strand:+ start:329 stop:460 length:132 start_codon:yes stop_codon:yes gene_type:complete